MSALPEWQRKNLSQPLLPFFRFQFVAYKALDSFSSADPFEEMQRAAGAIASIIRAQQRIKIITHIDADGITSASIVAKMLERAGIKYDVEFVKQLDPCIIEKIGGDGATGWDGGAGNFTIFTDLGSGLGDLIDGKTKNYAIADHHTVVAARARLPNELNPHFFGIDGATDISGAGVAYLIAKAFDAENADLSALAIVGAVGDMQDLNGCALRGANRRILEDAVNAGVVLASTDIRFFGRETRPIYKMLQFSDDPIIPGVTGREKPAIDLLTGAGVELKGEGREWRRWIDLTEPEKRSICSAIVRKLLSTGFGHKTAKRLIGEVYTLLKEEKGTPLHDAKEFATVLNATARHGKGDVGLNVCLGDREEWLKKAGSLLANHRSDLKSGIELIKGQIVQRRYLQHFHAQDGIMDTLVGIVAGMALNSEYADRKKPIIAFANKDENTVKVSSRASKELIDAGLNLATVLKECAAKLGGVGGGHPQAAGATIPKGKEEVFLDDVEMEIEKQIGGMSLRSGRARDAERPEVAQA